MYIGNVYNKLCISLLNTMSSTIWWNVLTRGGDSIPTVWYFFIFILLRTPCIKDCIVYLIFTFIVPFYLTSLWWFALFCLTGLWLFFNYFVYLFFYLFVPLYLTDLWFLDSFVERLLHDIYHIGLWYQLETPIWSSTAKLKDWYGSKADTRNDMENFMS